MVGSGGVGKSALTLQVKTINIPADGNISLVTQKKHNLGQT